MNRKNSMFIALTICFLLCIIIISSGKLEGKGNQVINSLKTVPLSQANAVLSPCIKADLSENTRIGKIEKRLRECISNIQSAQFHSSSVSAPKGSRQKQSTPELRERIGKDIEVLFRSPAGTPRQIKVKTLAKREGIVLKRAVTGFAPGREQDEQTARSFLNSIRGILRLSNPDEELKLTNYKQDELCRRHLRYSQMYRGLEVWPAELTIHLDPQGNVDLMNGAYVPTPRKIVTKPVIKANDASKRACLAVPDSKQAVVNDPDLIVYSPGDRVPRLAWKAEVSVSVASNWIVVIDALNGKILTAYNQVQNENKVGSGEDLFGNTHQLNLWYENNIYYMVDTGKPMYDIKSDPPSPSETNGAIIIMDMDNEEIPEWNTELPASYVTSQYTDSGWLREAVSLSYSFSETYDYFLERHNRNSIDGNGSTILGFVRLGQDYENAFWTTEFNAMFFGDALPYAGALDTVAHEFTHGVTTYSCNLVYRDQPGALNEAFSDIFGEMVEARTFGSTDWIHGTDLREDRRSLKDPSSVRIVASLGYYYPSRMSEFYERSHPLLQRFVNHDNGGVHINMTIISHAFYLLAEGLNGAIGLIDAEQIFYRAQNYHLVSNSRFIDARLNCIVSAEELFGEDSQQALKTAEAFDLVEVLDNIPTPEPPPIKPVSGDDSIIFIRYDPYEDAYFLARRDKDLDDGPLGSWLSCYDVNQSRPSVTWDGSIVFFVDSINDACFIDTEGLGCEECLGFPGLISSVAMSSDWNVFGFVLLDEYGDPYNEIHVIDLMKPEGEGDILTFTLVAPGTEGGILNTVLFADTMDFTSDNKQLVYDAFNILKMHDEIEIGVWSIYSLDIETGQINALIPPISDLDIGNPSLSQTSNSLLTFDVVDPNSSDSFIVALNLVSGDLSEVCEVNEPWGIPGYNGDDSAIVYTERGPYTSTGFSLMSQPVAEDKITPKGSPSLLLSDAAYGVIYRRENGSDISVSKSKASSSEKGGGCFIDTLI